jgi:hypothetical protein
MLSPTLTSLRSMRTRAKSERCFRQGMWQRSATLPWLPAQVVYGAVSKLASSPRVSFQPRICSTLQCFSLTKVLLRYPLLDRFPRLTTMRYRSCIHEDVISLAFSSSMQEKGMATIGPQRGLMQVPGKRPGSGAITKEDAKTEGFVASANQLLG